MGRLSEIDEPRLDDTTERHKIELHPAPSAQHEMPLDALKRDPSFGGIVMEISQGWVGGRRLLLARKALRLGRRVWAHWPAEQAVECIDRERLASAWRHWLFVTVGWRVLGVRRASALLRDAMRHFVRALRDARSRLPLWKIPLWILVRVIRRLVLAATLGVRGMGTLSPASRRARAATLDRFIADASPVPLDVESLSRPAWALVGRCGVYLRTDYWAKIESGGSYGHTCYVAKELARVTEDFVCFMAHRFALIDEFGIRQVEMPMPGDSLGEDLIVEATRHYFPYLREQFRKIK